MTSPEKPGPAQGPYAIHEVAMIGRSPCLTAIPVAWCDLLQAGHIPEEYVPVSAGHPAVYATTASAPNKVVGFIHYRVDDQSNCAHIIIGWVDAAHRKQGVYRDLYSWLRATCKANGVRTLYGVASADNLALQAVADRLGRRLSAVTYADSLG